MIGEVRALEELSFRTLPALEQERHAGWVLRWSDGGSRRGNSANPLEPAGDDLEAVIDYCEEWFRRRSTPTTFRVTELADTRLTEELLARGYRHTSPTDVMTMAIGEADAAEDVVVTERPSMEWLELVTGDSASAEAQRLADQITSGEGMLRFATLEADGQLAGAGVSVDLDRYTTIYNMVTAPDHQKRGVATRVVTTLLAMGRLAGSTHAVLQVTQDNSAAQGLYRKLGFEPAYDYWYLEP